MTRSGLEGFGHSLARGDGVVVEARRQRDGGGARPEPVHGFMRGRQRYRCKACGLNFTDTPPRGMPLAVKVTAVLLYVSGLSMNRPLSSSACRPRACRPGSSASPGPMPASPSPRAAIGAGDRARPDVALPQKKSDKLRVWKARDRATGRLAGRQCGDRDRATLKRLLKRVRRWRARLYCADDWAAYADLIPVGQLYVGRDQTHGIEGDHARQRHWLARFRRRSIVVSKAARMVDASIAPFARFGGNDKIQDLLSMLA